jgi:hypothetical protein
MAASAAGSGGTVRSVFEGRRGAGHHAGGQLSRVRQSVPADFKFCGTCGTA